MNLSVLQRIFLARSFRALGDGCICILLPTYLTLLGLNLVEVGWIITATVLGSGVMSLALSFHAWRWGFRVLLVCASMAMVATGMAMTQVSEFWPLMVVGFLGTLNASMDDVSVFLPLEHALISQSTLLHTRTRAFSQYALVGSLVGALGALGAQTPSWLVAQSNLDMTTALQGMFVLYAILGAVSALLYRGLPSNVSAQARVAAPPLAHSRTRVVQLTALFSIDALGGGMVVHSMMSLYLMTLFGLSVSDVSLVFLCMGMINAVSFLTVPSFTRSIGLLNTMLVFHVPASLLLVAIALAPSPAWAVGFLLTRSMISSLDVPARAAYVMSLVTPGERAAAASLTSLPRSFATSAGPWMSGALLTYSGFGWPLVLAGSIKLLYAALLWRGFRSVPLIEDAAAKDKS